MWGACLAFRGMTIAQTLPSMSNELLPADITGILSVGEIRASHHIRRIGARSS